MDVATWSVTMPWALRNQMSIREIARWARNTLKQYLRSDETERSNESKLQRLGRAPCNVGLPVGTENSGHTMDESVRIKSAQPLDGGKLGNARLVLQQCHVKAPPCKASIEPLQARTRQVPKLLLVRRRDRAQVRCDFRGDRRNCGVVGS
jgi:hypothetical protein